MCRITIIESRKSLVYGSTRFRLIHPSESISYSLRMKRSSSSGSAHSTGFARFKLLTQSTSSRRRSKSSTPRGTQATSIGSRTPPQLRNQAVLLHGPIFGTMHYHKQLKSKMELELINRIRQRPDRHQHHSLE